MKVKEYSPLPPHLSTVHTLQGSDPRPVLSDFLKPGGPLGRALGLKADSTRVIWSSLWIQVCSKALKLFSGSVDHDTGITVLTLS